MLCWWSLRFRRIPAISRGFARRPVQFCISSDSFGFKITDRHLKRAGLDYWDAVNMVRHRDFKDFAGELMPQLRGTPTGLVPVEPKSLRPMTPVFASTLHRGTQGHGDANTESSLPNFFLFSTKGKRLYTDAHYQPGDALIFGSETKGLPDEILEAYPDNVLAIPMRTDAVRSLNLATAAGIVLYEALRQIAVQ